MSGSNFYKHAFWLLLAAVAVFQVVITIVAHSRHSSSDDAPVLLSKGRLPVTVPKIRSVNLPGHSRDQQQAVQPSVAAASGSPKKKVWEEVLSTSPRIVLLHNFATKDECEHLIELGISKGMQRAQIIPYGGNELIDSSTRTNTAAWLNYHQDSVVTRIENELAKYTKTHPLDGESLQILHYGSGQSFKPHRDAFDPKEDPPENFEPGGNRIITALVYLQNAEEGGETFFTKLDMHTKPDAGDALLFWNTNSDGSICLESEHAGTPPVKGQKWVATKWVHERLYQLKEAERMGISPQQLSEERAGSLFS